MSADITDKQSILKLQIVNEVLVVHCRKILYSNVSFESLGKRIVRHYKIGHFYMARLTSGNRIVISVDTQRSQRATFYQFYRDGKMTLEAENRRLVCRESDDSIRAFGTVAERRCLFEEGPMIHQHVFLKADNGKYVCPNWPSRDLIANGKHPCYFFADQSTNNTYCTFLQLNNGKQSNYHNLVVFSMHIFRLLVL